MKRNRWILMGVVILLALLLVAQLVFARLETAVTQSTAAFQSTAPDVQTTITQTQRITPTIITAVSLPTSSGPVLTHGPLSGEVTEETAVLWARGSEAGELTFTVATATDSEFADIVATVSVALREENDLTGEGVITNLDPNTAYHYRATLTVDDETSEVIQGFFTTAPAADEVAPISFVFGSCLGGQGYCRDPETGWFIFETMQAQNPDFFIITGDTVYVDSACTEPNNVPGAEGPYNDLAGFHTRYRYHLEDDHYANFLAQTPIYVTWDDHEIIDDFGGPALSRFNAEMFNEGEQAFFDYWPLTKQAEEGLIYRAFQQGAHAEFIMLDTRSYRDPNVNWDPHPVEITPKTMLGAEQFAWLQERLAESTATWKFIVTSVPLSYPTGFPQPEVDGRDSWANYTEKSGYETELLALLFYIESQNIDNVVFLTGDTHWPFAMSYDPDRDGNANFYELASSPLSAINLAPVAKPDPTFNPTVMFAEGTFLGTVFNFGHVAIDDEGALTFRIVDRDDNELYAVTLEPEL